MKFYFKKFIDEPSELIFTKATEIFSMKINETHKEFQEFSLGKLESNVLDPSFFKTMVKFDPPFDSQPLMYE